MRLSGNEIAALAVKAARGAGLPLGHAEDMRAAAVLLAARGDLAVMAAALDGDQKVPRYDDGRIEGARAAMVGPIAIDLVRCGAEILTQVDAPDLVRALAEAAGGVEVTVQGDNLRLKPANRAAAALPEGPFEVSPEVIEALNIFAARTYVPASEASRLAGAGAGLSDND